MSGETLPIPDIFAIKSIQYELRSREGDMGYWVRRAGAGWADHIRRTCEFTAIHGAAIVLTWFVIYPVQSAVQGRWLADSLFVVPVLLFLPAVIKALAAWMYGWWAMLYILPTALLQHLLLDLPIDLAQLSKLSVYLVSAPLVRSALVGLGLQFAGSRGPHSWRCLIIIVLLSSMMLAGMFLLLYGADASVGEAGLFVTLFLFGDIAGSAFVLVLLLVIFRVKESRQRVGRVHREV